MRTVNSLLIVAVLLFATVMIWTYAAVRGNDQTFQSGAGIGGGPGDLNSSNNQTNYRGQLITLLPEHGNVAIMHLTMLYDGKDTRETSKKLEDNGGKLADVIKTLGTTTDRELFLRTFRGHIKEYENYTKAKKANNQAAMNAAKEHLQMHAMEFGELTHKLMPSISEVKGTALMNDHAALTLAIVDAHAKGDTAQKLIEMSNANTQALQFAEELATGAENASK